MIPLLQQAQADWRKQDALWFIQVQEQLKTFRKLYLKYITQDNLKICKKIRSILAALEKEANGNQSNQDKDSKGNICFVLAGDDKAQGEAGIRNNQPSQTVG